MADLLSASSLLATIVAVLFSLWYPEIQSALAITPERKRADRDPQIVRVKTVLATRALPLLAASGSLCLILLPVAFGVAADTVAAIARVVQGSSWTYDALRAAFGAAFAFTLGMTILAMQQVRNLRTCLRRLEAPDPSH